MIFFSKLGMTSSMLKNYFSAFWSLFRSCGIRPFAKEMAVGGSKPPEKNFYCLVCGFANKEPRNNMYSVAEDAFMESKSACSVPEETLSKHLWKSACSVSQLTAFFTVLTFCLEMRLKAYWLRWLVGIVRDKLNGHRLIA